MDTSRSFAALCAMLCVGFALLSCDCQQPEQASGDLKALTLDLGSGVTMELMLIPPGEFLMGSPNSEAGRRGDEGPQHKVQITKPFYMGKSGVTQAQFEAVMGRNPAHFEGADNPVDTVSWTDAQDFCRKLGKRASREVRLPTEAEWEYACRAGTTTVFSFGDSAKGFGKYAWYSNNSGLKTRPVGQKKPNAWGLHDVHGNVWEWCQGWYGKDYYKGSRASDPTGPPDGSDRVLRGGSCIDEPEFCRSAIRAVAPQAGAPPSTPAFVWWYPPSNPLLSLDSVLCRSCWAGARPHS
ncbi:MAG: formylglycine-generating enzyme family protein [Candidatus Brocadiia bacterium]|nr:formylglycine-generating enzyme family protein [Candidatus Brocadiia bacterium]